jgi:catechol 2,3-dioxygenase-like lactoylglutathione lyase family enzyme
MQLQTIVYVTDMERSIAFYEGLGFEVAYHGGPVWTAFRGSDGVLALHLVEELPEPGRVAVSLVADGPLEDTIAGLSGRGIVASSIETQPFGRSTVVRDPDGLAIQINEHAD